MPCSGNDRAARMSFRGPGASSVWENLVGFFRLPLMTLLTLALFPVVRELGTPRGACASWCWSSLLQPRGLMPGGHCPRGGSAGSRSVLQELTASCAWGGLLSPSPGCPPPSLSRQSQLGRLVVEQRGAGGAELVGTSSASRALSLFPSVPGGLALFREPSAAPDRHR